MLQIEKNIMSAEHIIAVGLLRQSDLDLLGSRFDRLWPVDETPCFNGLLQAIDEADREFRRERDQTAQASQPDVEIPIMRIT